eukprot:CAMPEP_0184296176 /NCGR_PEP_ID=MMETSP1049-20130417/7154_1 /TAXON_ID=77928 /ORGANISM="Proteomonas sulcata, Strain CCMP704" /LENGTH=76 /DNA_ID=CAMNT_0026605253 /DNA_START=229 /DNA_END=456 /DNA_ORIENTATION=-
MESNENTALTLKFHPKPAKIRKLQGNTNTNSKSEYLWSLAVLEGSELVVCWVKEMFEVHGGQSGYLSALRAGSGLA